MAVEGIQISLEEVKQTASEIRNINNGLTSRLEEIKMQMDSLSQTWQSDASETIRSKFNGLAPRFEEYAEIVESYALFLENTASVYETTEANINSNASAFK